jgi:serine/threonine-protein kinase
MRFEKSVDPTPSPASAFAEEVCSPLDDLAEASWEEISGLGRGAHLESLHPAWIPSLIARQYSNYDPGLVQQGLTIVAKVGQGGSGTVFIAWDECTGSFIALKGLPENVSPADHERLCASLLREADLTSGIQHPHILSSQGVVLGSRGPYFQMEAEIHLDFSGPVPRIVRNNDLAVLIKRAHTLGAGEPASLRPLIQNFGIICDAVAFLHDHGIAHGDIKPTNILFDSGGKPMLADFGEARLMNSSDAGLVGNRGVFTGTPGFCAPEIIKCEDIGRVDSRSEVYSLGAVFYTLLTACAPFDEIRGPVALRFFAAVVREPVSIRQLNPQIPAEWEAICRKALSVEPEARFQTVQEFKNSLVGLLG